MLYVFVSADFCAIFSLFSAFQEVSQATKKLIQGRMAYYADEISVEGMVSEADLKLVTTVYSQTMVLHDIMKRRWACPVDLRSVLYRTEPPMLFTSISDDFGKAFIGCTNISGIHFKRLSAFDKLDFSSMNEKRLAKFRAVRASCADKILKGNSVAMVWNDGYCYIVRQGVEQEYMYIPTTFHVFNSRYFPVESATPSQMYQSSRIMDTNHMLYCTPIYAAIVEGLTYMARNMRFDVDLFVHHSTPVVLKHRHIIMTDVSQTHGRALFAAVPNSMLEDGVIVYKDTIMACMSGMVRADFPHGEHYAMEYLHALKNFGDGYCSQLVTTMEANHFGSEKIFVGSPAFFANCSHEGNCYMKGITLKGPESVSGSKDFYKLPMLQASYDLRAEDFIRGEEVARKAGYGPVEGYSRLALEFQYSPRHVSREPSADFVKCRCLSECERDPGSNFHFFMDSKPKEMGTVQYDRAYISKMKVHKAQKESIARWMAQGNSIRYGFPCARTSGR